MADDGCPIIYLCISFWVGGQAAEWTPVRQRTVKEKCPCVWGGVFFFYFCPYKQKKYIYIILKYCPIIIAPTVFDIAPTVVGYGPLSTTAV